jgi:hypothetical protein
VLEGWLKDGAELAGLKDGGGDVICKDGGSWSWLSGGEGESAELAAVL